MYEYVPAKLAASPPVLVASHYCGGSASAMFGFTGMPAIEAAADQYGFVMIFPQTTNPATSADCWDVGSKASLTHDGGGDTQAIAEMVQYEITKRSANPNRVYAMGASSGAMLTEALMAVYPDVFKAGAEFSGVPAGCWSDGWSAASNWGGTCADGQDTMTGPAWGNLVRGMFPGYAGYRPRLQLWHGTADATINYNNEGQAILEWTNVLGLNATPNSTDTTSVSGFTIEKWQNSCDFTVLEAHIQAGGGHTTPIDANSVISFFGLNEVTGPDPQVAACDGGGAEVTGGPDAGAAAHDGGGSTTGSTSGSATGAGTSGSVTGSGTSGSVTGSGTGGSAGAAGSANTGSATGTATGDGTGSTAGSESGAGAGLSGSQSGTQAGSGTGGDSPPGGCAIRPTGAPGDSRSPSAVLVAIAVGLGLSRRRRG